MTVAMEYAGFWVRVGASILDSILVLFVTLPLLIAIYGWDYFDLEVTGFIAGFADFLISWAAPAVAIIAFWVYRQATPGKRALAMKVVDAKTGRALTLGQAVIRYLGYFISMIPFCIGFVWVAFDSRKQGWHDKLAGTVVVRSGQREPQALEFEQV